MQIKNNVQSLKTATTDEFFSWEFNTLKEDKDRNIKKLKNNIIKSGLDFPAIVWVNKNKVFVIDGKSRRIAIEEMLDEGYSFDEGIPYVTIFAENKNEAKKKALSVSSQFSKVSKDSFMAYVEGIDDLDFETFEIVDINKDFLIDEEFNTDFNLPDGEKPPFQQITFTLSNEQFENVKKALAEVKKTDEYKFGVNYGNENNNGNAIATIVDIWLQQNR